MPVDDVIAIRAFDAAQVVLDDEDAEKGQKRGIHLTTSPRPSSASMVTLSASAFSMVNCLRGMGAVTTPTRGAVAWQTCQSPVSILLLAVGRRVPMKMLVMRLRVSLK